jgi:hypothetical protein
MRSQADREKARVEELKTRLERERSRLEVEARNKAALLQWEIAKLGGHPPAMESAIYELERLDLLPPEIKPPSDPSVSSPEGEPSDTPEEVKRRPLIQGLYSKPVKPPEWEPVPTSGRMYRTDSEGKIITHEFPRQETFKDDTVKQVFKEARLVLWSKAGLKHMETGFMEAFKSAEGRIPLFIDEKNSRIIFPNLDDPRGEPLVVQVEPPLGSPLVDPGMLNDIYIHMMGMVDKGEDSTSNALITGRNLLANVPNMTPEMQQAKLIEWTGAVMAYKGKIPTTTYNVKLLQTSSALQATADRMIKMLESETLRKDIGPLVGRWGSLTREITQGKHDTKELAEFASLMLNMKDLLIARPRSGGAVTETEIELYDHILGSEKTDARILPTLLQSVIDLENTVRVSLFETQMELKGETFGIEDSKFLIYKQISDLPPEIDDLEQITEEEFRLLYDDDPDPDYSPPDSVQDSVSSMPHRLF